MIKPAKRKSTASLGCGFLFGAGILMILLLAINSWLVRTFAKGLLGFDERLFQATLFVAPALMIFAEFWIYDRFFARRSRNR